MKYNPPVGGAADDPYVDEDPGTGTAGSIVSGAAIEHVQREIVDTITQAGLTPSEVDLTQLYGAIVAIVASNGVADASETVKGIVERATDAEVTTGTDTARYMSVKQIVDAIAAAATVEQLKAWVNFNGIGTVAIRDSYNVSSITDNGTADYTVNFTTSFANANYVGNVTTGSDTILSNVYGLFPVKASPTVSAARIGVNTSNNVAIDTEYVFATFFGDQ